MIPVTSVSESNEESPTDVEALGRSHLRARIKASHGSMLLTLVSIVQGAVFSYLAFVLVGRGGDLSMLGWMLAVATFVLIVLTWNEYFMGITSIVYIPDMMDSFFPFLMGVVQVGIVHSVSNDPRAWLLTMFAYSVLSFFSFLNMYAKGIREEENTGLYACLRWHVYTSMLMPILGAPVFLLLWWWVDATESVTSYAMVGVYAISLLGAYGTRTVLYWRRIVKYASADVPARGDLSMFRLIHPRRLE
jgi:hypothetical protein